MLDVADRDQQVILYLAAPGGPDEQAPQLLAVLGTERMDVAR